MESLIAKVAVTPEDRSAGFVILPILGSIPNSAVTVVWLILFHYLRLHLLNGESPLPVI